MSSGNDRPEETMTGLAKRWLKTQLRFHGDPHKGVRDRREAEALEQRMEEKAQEDFGRAVFNTVMPPSWKQKISDMERQSEERKVERANKERAEHEARPRVAVRLAFSGDITGQIQTDLPVRITEPAGEDPHMLVELEPLEPVAIGDHWFNGFHFAIPNYTGAGRYDLAATPEDERMNDWDPFWFQLWLDSTDESYFWTEEYGPAVIVVDEDERTIHVRMAMENASSTHVDLDLTVVRP